ncbi:hypothetical protein, partial [Staphylococcus epidermidis]|uniref:hypothetical protein n=1 Tax=Staphylococcus epidermidis TaxID=1282 RepID=UPI001C93179A
MISLKRWIVVVWEELFWGLMRKILGIRRMEVGLLLEEEVKGILVDVVGDERNGDLVVEKVK